MARGAQQSLSAGFGSRESAGRWSAPQTSCSFGRNGALLRFLGIGWRWIARVLVIAFLNECRKALAFGGSGAFGLGAPGDGGAQRFRQPPRTGQQPLGLLGHF